LATGTYTVFVEATGYLPQNMTGVNVVEDQITSNIDFQMSKIPPAQSGTISGTVTGDLNPIPELQYPIAALLIATATAISLTRLFNAKTRRAKLLS
jgi:hypothetical protein